MDWDFVFAQLKRFYRCSKDEFKKMTLHETFKLLEDGEKLAKAESGEKMPEGAETKEQKIRRLRAMAKKHKGKRLQKLQWKNGRYVPVR